VAEASSIGVLSPEPYDPRIEEWITYARGIVYAAMERQEHSGDRRTGKHRWDAPGDSIGHSLNDYWPRGEEWATWRTSSGPRQPCRSKTMMDGINEWHNRCAGNVGQRDNAEEERDEARREHVLLVGLHQTPLEIPKWT
jgi:hypothetical protein